MLGFMIPHIAVAQQREATAFVGLPFGDTSEGPIRMGARAGAAIEHVRCGGQAGPSEFRGEALLLVVDSAGHNVTRPAVDVTYNLRFDTRDAGWRVSPYARVGAGIMLIVKEGHPMPVMAGVALGATFRTRRFLEISYHHVGNASEGMRLLSLQAGWSWRVGSEPREVCDP